MGDLLLPQLVIVISSNVRSMDMVYRYGGEEFVILLPAAKKGIAILASERLRAAVIKEKFTGEEFSQPEKKVTVSIGLATYTEDAVDGKTLTETADRVLYNAKKDERNRVSPF